MKKLYITLLVSLFIFATTTHTAEETLPHVSSTETLDGLELSPLIDQNARSTTPELTISFIEIHRQHAMRQLETNRLQRINQNDTQVNDNELTPPYTCPACIINLAAYPIKQTKKCVKKSYYKCCKDCMIPTCNSICMFTHGHDCYAIAALPDGDRLRPTDDSCCGKCNKYSDKCIDTSCTCLECDKCFDESSTHLARFIKKSKHFCEYTLCCLWLEQHSNRNEE